MSFREYQKNIKRKKEENQTLRMLEHAVSTFAKQKEEYLNEAKDALKRGDRNAYNSAAMILKNIIFQLAQAQDMLVNFKAARDMREMNSLSAHFVRSMDRIMLSLQRSGRQINFNKSRLIVQKSLYDRGKTAEKLRDLLSDNGMAFSQTVNSVSDVTDDDIYNALQNVIAAEDRDADAMLDELESMYNKEESSKTPDNTKPEPQKVSVNKEKPHQGASTGAPAGEAVPNEEKEGDKAPSSNKKPASGSDNSGDNAGGKAPETRRPEDAVLSSPSANSEYNFDWDSLPNITFDDVAGLEDVKDAVFKKVLLPLKNPEAFEGYSAKKGGGLLLYGPPGTGKTMIAAAIANEIGAKFCAVQPSDLLKTGFGQSERAIRALFEEARQFPCAVIYFDEIDFVTPKTTKSQYSKNLRSEFLAQINGMSSYQKDDDRILYLIGATNKPWDIESAFLRTGRFGTRIYVGLPDEDSRRYMIERRLSKLRDKGIVEVADDIDVDEIVKITEGFNGSDIDGLMDSIEEDSIARSTQTGKKHISKADFDEKLAEVRSSVQKADIENLMAWKAENG